MYNNATPEVVNQYGRVRPKNPQQVARGVGSVNVLPLAEADKAASAQPLWQTYMQAYPQARQNPRLLSALAALRPQQR